MTEEIELINKKLLEEYGEFEGSTLPKYRLVWSTEQFENRYGKFAIFSETGSIFLREEEGVYYTPKYPGWTDLWILEKLQSTVGNPYLERVTKVSYEPIWVFGAGNSEKKPIWRAVRLLVENSLHGDPNRINKSPADLQKEEDEKIEKEKKRMKEFLAEDTDGLAYQLKHGGAVFIDSEKRLEQKRGKSANTRDRSE